MILKPTSSCSLQLSDTCIFTQYLAAQAFLLLTQLLCYPHNFQSEFSLLLALFSCRGNAIIKPTVPCQYVTNVDDVIFYFVAE